MSLTQEAFPRFVERTRKVDAKQFELPIYEQVMDNIGKQ